MMPVCITKRLVISVSLPMALLLLISSSYGKHKAPAEEPPFLYESVAELFTRDSAARRCNCFYSAPEFPPLEPSLADTSE